MKIKGKNISLLQMFCLTMYYGFLTYLPVSTFPVIGKFCRKLRYLCCKHIFLYCGQNVNIERKAKFGSGLLVRIDDNSGIGVNCFVPSDINIGKNVMMGPNCYILHANHEIDRTDITMIDQGHTSIKQTIIEDDVWIGRQVLFTPGRIVKKGSIVGAGCVLTKDFPEYSIIGGNPSKLIRSRR